MVQLKFKDFDKRKVHMHLRSHWPQQEGLCLYVSYQHRTLYISPLGFHPSINLIMHVLCLYTPYWWKKLVYPRILLLISQNWSLSTKFSYHYYKWKWIRVLVDPCKHLQLDIQTQLQPNLEIIGRRRIDSFWDGMIVIVSSFYIKILFLFLRFCFNQPQGDIGEKGQYLTF